MSAPARIRRGGLRGLRAVGVWGLPTLVTILLLVVGLAWWCVASQAGTRWLLRTAAGQFGGQVQGVRGTIADGLYVGGLSLSLQNTDVRVVGLHLKALWPELLDRRLHINDLSAVRVDVAVRPSAEPSEPSGPFRMPALPVGVQIDHLSLGGLGLRLGDAGLPVEVLSASAALTLDADTATVALHQLQVAHGDTLMSVHGNLALRGLAAPWPFELNLHGTAQDRGPQSPVCVRRILEGTRVRAEKPAGDAAKTPAAAERPAAEKTAAGQAPAGKTAAGAEAEGGPSCQVDLDLRLAGTLDAFHLQAQGAGEGLSLEADAEVFPRQAFPLGKADVRLALPDKAGLDLHVQPGAPDAEGLRLVRAAFAARNLVLDPWLPEGVGATRLGLDGELQVRLTAAHQLQDAGLSLQIGAGSRWNGQPLAGHVNLPHVGAVQGTLLDAAGPAAFDPFKLRAEGMDIALDLGPDRLRLSGDVSAARSQVALQATLPSLSAAWPGLPGGARLKLDTSGSLAQHRLSLAGRYVPPDAREGIPGHAPIDLDLGLEGGWTRESGWQGRLTALQAGHAGARLRVVGPVELGYDAAGQWHVGQGALDVALDGQPLLQLRHEGSAGGAGQWETRGRIDPLVVTPERIAKLQAWLGKTGSDLGGVNTALSEQAQHSRLRLALDWNLKFAGALQGEVHLVRLDGDLTVPGDVPIELGLETARLDLAIRPVSEAASKAALDLRIVTRDMGRVHVQADTLVHATPGGGLGLRAQDEKNVRVQAESEDLAWVNLLLGGAAEVGGVIHADVRGRSLPRGGWALSGPVRGEDMRLLILDQGVRLLDGTLQAHFDGMRLVLDHLRFPAVRRVAPKEWRTATWVAENPDAQDGFLDVSGLWDLDAQSGEARVGFSRYPILQRSDRYAMISGELRVRADLPRIDLSGKIVADAGWFDLDMLNNIPSLDSDVVVLKPGQATPTEPESPPLDMRADLTVDLGPRFYLTGYGLDSGLVGSLDLHLVQGKLTALGALRTRGGAINAYGQHLQLRRGTVTFQGDVTNPVLDIQALRTDVAVQAGVQVAGTARRPRIDLISRPEVSETEKLTWLLLGHGPDDAGGDMSLLFSVGSSFLSGGEPFYKRFGLDELSMRSGELGSTGSILPVESVVSGLDAGASPIEQRFVRASKALAKDLTISLEQALAQTGTVARLSYRLMRNLQAEMTVGTVSGLALVYRWFSRD